ncbi:hypothetical protein Tco_0442624 [Tanacetum coccineum]
MLGAARVQIPENNLDNLHSSGEEDETSETMDPQDLLGSLLLADIDLIILGLLTRTLVLDFIYNQTCKMAISSSSSSSSSDNKVQKCSKCLESFKCLQKNYDTEREKHNKAKLEIRGYEIALESLEARILGHEKNELAWGERYEFQNYDLKCREIKINNLNLELEKMSTHDKNGLGFGTQMDNLSNKSKTDSENSLTIFEVRSSDEESTLANNRFTKANEYHAIPLPQKITGNLLNPRADISFAGLDEYAIRNKIIESKTLETTKTLGNTNDKNAKKPKSVNEKVVSKSKINRDKVIIKDWTSDDKDDVCAVQTVSSG